MRELRNAAERYALGFGESARHAGRAKARQSLAEQVEAFERTVIERASPKVAAAHRGMERLDIPRRTLSEKMARLGLDRRDFVDADRQKSPTMLDNGGNPPKRNGKITSNFLTK